MHGQGIGCTSFLIADKNRSWKNMRKMLNYTISAKKVPNFNISEAVLDVKMLIFKILSGKNGRFNQIPLLCSSFQI